MTIVRECDIIPSEEVMREVTHRKRYKAQLAGVPDMVGVLAPCWEAFQAAAEKKDGKLTLRKARDYRRAVRLVTGGRVDLDIRGIGAEVSKL